MPKAPIGAAAENAGPGTVTSVYRIAGACATVRATNPELRHIWIDTVCINKQYHQKFSSAVNSLFRRYHQGAVYYVYLFDVTWDTAAIAIGRTALRRLKDEHLVSLDC